MVGVFMSGTTSICAQPSGKKRKSCGCAPQHAASCEARIRTRASELLQEGMQIALCSQPLSSTCPPVENGMRQERECRQTRTNRDWLCSSETKAYINAASCRALRCICWNPPHPIWQSLSDPSKMGQH